MPTLEDIDRKYKGVCDPKKIYLFSKYEPKRGSKEEKWFYLTEEGMKCCNHYRNFDFGRGMELFFDELGIGWDEKYRHMTWDGLVDEGILTNEECTRLKHIYAAAIGHLANPPYTFGSFLIKTKEGHMILIWLLVVILGSFIHAFASCS